MGTTTDNQSGPGQDGSRPSLGQPTPWLTVQEAADYASLSADTIYTACERGELRHANTRASCIG